MSKVAVWSRPSSGQAFGLAIFQNNSPSSAPLAFGDQPLGLITIEIGAVEEDVVGTGEIGHNLSLQTRQRAGVNQSHDIARGRGLSIVGNT